jgi:outer membrane protein TolC
MKRITRNLLPFVALGAACLTGLAGARLTAQEKIASPSSPVKETPATVRITLEEAKQRAISSNKLLNLASLNAESKAFAVKAMRANYFPQIVGNIFYFHFNDDLGEVVTAGGRTITGPRGMPLATPTLTIFNIAVLNQDSSFATLNAVQPITDLLKVRQGVKIAQADEGIARAQLEAGIRKVASGVEQLYWGLLAAQRLRAGSAAAVSGGEVMVKSVPAEGKLPARIALQEARQALQQVDAQIADLQEQLNGLLNLPLCTILELVTPDMPVLTYHCADEVIGMAIAASPEIREAQQTVLKAEAALRAGKLDYVPSIGLVGGYANQTGASYIQQDIGYVGIVGSYTFWDWGKRRNVVRERKNLVGMASLKLQETEEEVRQKAVKLFREVSETQEALKTAQEMAELRGAAVKQATIDLEKKTAEALTTLLKASKDLMLAQVDAVKADLAYRMAYVQLMALIGMEDGAAPSCHAP